MSDFANNIRASLDKIRGIPAILGLRPYSLSVRIRSWSGERIGLGTATIVDQDLSVADGYQPRIRQLSQKDILASNGLYSDQDLEILLTPLFVSICGIGGYSTDSFDPPIYPNPIEILFNIKGNGHPPEGSWYKKISQSTDLALTFTIIIRKTGEV